MPSFDEAPNTIEFSIPSDNCEENRLKMERDLDRELEGFSLSQPNGAQGTGAHFFPESPNQETIDREFRDFSLGRSESLDLSIEQGMANLSPHVSSGPCSVLGIDELDEKYRLQLSAPISFCYACFLRSVFLAKL